MSRAVDEGCLWQLRREERTLNIGGDLQLAFHEPRLIGFIAPVQTVKQRTKKIPQAAHHIQFTSRRLPVRFENANG